jgi:hypothetical protein
MTMTAIRITTTVLTVVMFVGIVVSVATGDFSSESETLLDLAWGRMSLVDIYVGIALIFGWVVIREERLWVAIVWLPVFIVLGNAGTALYAALASFRSPDVRTFLLGRHA